MAYTRAHHVGNQTTDKVSKGRGSEHLLNNPGTVLNLQLRPAIYMGLFHKNV